MNLRWMDCSGKYILLWTGKKVELYEASLDPRIDIPL